MLSSILELLSSVVSSRFYGKEMLYSTTGHLTPTAPFDFAKSLEFLSGFRPTAGEQALAERALAKAVLIDGQTIVFRVTSSGEVEAPRLDYTLSSDQPIDAATARAAADRLAFFLSLSDDLRPFYAIGRDDGAFVPVVERLYGYHQVKFLTPFENACWAILSQRNTMPAARNLKQTLVERFGASLEVAGTRYEAFPEAARVAAADPAELLAIVHNLRRDEYLAAVARAFCTVDEAWLRASPYDEVEAWLRAIDGIGPWSASFILLRGLGRTERLPVGEKRLAEAAGRLYNQGPPLSEAALRPIAERYGAWQGYWAHYLRVAG
jgi:DNA-3-methyladenine glycosylase II